ncbi:MAG: ferrochelatase [Salinibacter sp.]
MTPLEFLQRYDREQYNSDPRMVNGEFFPTSTLGVESGETVGVVLLNLGGPDSPETVEPFLYNLFMDPAIIDFSQVIYLQARGRARQAFSKIISYFRSKSVAEDYKEISDDGGSPINPLTREQADNLEHRLNEQYAAQTGVTFKTYMAMRYWEPTSEQAAEQMQADGVDRVVLLPLYPQYSKTTTGASLVYWHELEAAGEIPAWPTTSVFEYATYPTYIEALSERIDEGLERFPDDVRDDVHFLFSAHGTPLTEMKDRRDPYCCLVHSTVKNLMEHRGFDHDFTTAFQSKVGPSEWLTPATDDTVAELAEEDEDVLVIPVAFVTDHIETSYELAIEIPEELEEDDEPIPEHYEVMPGLNSHPKFIEALADVTAMQLNLPHANTPAPPSARPRCAKADRDIRCHQCERIAEATDWTEDPERTPTPA